MYRFRGFYIPERMMLAVQRYIKDGEKPGGFLQAVICNDLFAAVGRADEENLTNLPAYIGYFYNEAPSESWGSREKMEAWIEKHSSRRGTEWITT